jgi:O-antigen/teichoic acid export membrane protein
LTLESPDPVPAGPQVTPSGVDERTGILFSVNLVFLSQIAIYGLAFGLRVVLARGLGDDGLGTYSLFFTAVLVAGGVANLGVGLGNIYFLNKGQHSYEELLSGSLFVLAASSLVTWVFLVAYGVIIDTELFVSGRSYWLYGAALPAVVGYVLLTSFLHGSSRFPALSTVAVFQGVTGLAIVGALYAADELDVFWALAGWAASFLLADLLALVLIGLHRVDFAAVLRPRWDVLREQIRYGAQGQIANLAQLFNYRLDQFLVAAFVSRAGVGHYTVAVGLAESVWWLSSSVALVLMPRLTEMDSDRAAEMTPLACRNTLLASVLAAVALVVVSPLAIDILFGDEFSPAQWPLILLMPGIIAASATRVLGSYLFSQGRIIYNTYATFIALGLTIALDFALIPPLEVEGAAIASSIAYTASLLATLYWYHQVSGGSIREALLFRPSDLRYYAEAWDRVRERMPLRGKATDERDG